MAETPPVPSEAALSPPAPDSLPPAPSRGTVLNSALWIGLGFGLGQVIRFVSSIVLAWLLFPHAFGLMSLSFAFLTGLHLFADLGVSISIVQNPRGDDPDFLNTAWTIQILRGFFLWLAASLLAWPAAYWRPEIEPDLLWLLPLVGLTSILDGLTSTKLFSLHRHLAQRKAVLIDLVGSVTSVVVMIVWASIQPDVMALAAGPLAGGSVKLLLSHLLPGPRNCLRWEKSSVKELVHFGRWIYISTVCSFLADQADKVLVSFLSVTILGVYHIASQLALIPATLMTSIARQLIFPLYSRLIDAGHDVSAAARRMQMRAGALAALLVSGLIATGPSLVRCLYDERYHAAGWILPLLTISAWFQILEANASSLLFAKGKPRLPALANATKVLCLLICIPIGCWFDGLRGLIIALIFGDIARYLFSGMALRAEGIAIFRRDLGWSIFVAASSLLALGSAGLLAPLASEGPRNWPRLLTRLGVETGIVVCCWTLVVAFGWHSGWFDRKDDDSTAI